MLHFFSRSFGAEHPEVSTASRIVSLGTLGGHLSRENYQTVLGPRNSLCIGLRTVDTHSEF
jgi:hypothetical protein